jgi:hypothetical protein
MSKAEEYFIKHFGYAPLKDVAEFWQGFAQAYADQEHQRRLKEVSSEPLINYEMFRLELKELFDEDGKFYTGVVASHRQLEKMYTLIQELHFELNKLKTE